MSRTLHHRDAISPRRYLLKDWPPRRRILRSLWHLREAVAEVVGTALPPTRNRQPAAIFALRSS